VAVDALGQLGHQHHTYQLRALRRLAKLAEQETDDDVQWSIVFGVSHIGLPAGLPVLLTLRHSTDPDVRYQVAQGIPAIAAHADHAQALRVLGELSEDKDKGVRDRAMAAIDTLRGRVE
jgi:HEAT repeat protein